MSQNQLSVPEAQSVKAKDPQLYQALQKVIASVQQLQRQVQQLAAAAGVVLK